MLPPPPHTVAENENLPLDFKPTFVFPPGHRVLITSFINDIKSKNMLKCKDKRKRVTDDQQRKLKLINHHPAIVATLNSFSMMFIRE